MEETKTLKIEIPEGYEIDKEKSTFENIVFKKVKNKFSRNWEEFCENNPLDDDDYKIDSITANIQRAVTINTAPRFTYRMAIIPRKYTEPMLALMQLLTIREKEYTKGWEPDWTNFSEKYCIASTYNEIITTLNCNASHALSFPTQKLCNEFLKNWKALIEIAKPLL